MTKEFNARALCPCLQARLDKITRDYMAKFIIIYFTKNLYTYIYIYICISLFIRIHFGYIFIYLTLCVYVLSDTIIHNMQ